MFGSGIGELNVYIRPLSSSDPDKKIWGLNGDAGNNWYMAQAPVASAKPFKVYLQHTIFRDGLIFENQDTALCHKPRVFVSDKKRFQTQV